MTSSESSLSPGVDPSRSPSALPPQSAPVARSARGSLSGAVRAQDCTDCIFSNCKYPSRTACRMWCPEIC